MGWFSELWEARVPKFTLDDEDVWQSLWRGSISEFLATAIFVFLGTGSVVAAQTMTGGELGVPALTLISIAHGFAIMILVYSIGEVSGGHINPAITWALLVTNKLSILRAVCYIASQLGGAIVGSAILKSLHPHDLAFNLGCHTVHPGLTAGQGLWTEVVLTFIFVFVVFATAVSPFAGKMAPLSGSEYGPGKLAPFAIGMTIMCLHTVGIAMTGASMNPARSFGPAMIAGGPCWEHHWVYWLGPLLGATIAAMTCQMIFLSHLRAISKVFDITRGKRVEAGQSAPVPGQSKHGFSQLGDNEGTQEISLNETN